MILADPQVIFKSFIKPSSYELCKLHKKLLKMMQ